VFEFLNSDSRRRILDSLFVFLSFLFVTPLSSAQIEQAIPYEIRIGVSNELIPGQQVSIPVTLTGGSEEMRGFDFLIAYEEDFLTLSGITAGEIFSIPGEYEWEYITALQGPPPECGQLCPSGIINVISIADINDGVHHPLNDPETGRIKILPEGTELFAIEFEINQFLPPAVTELPVYFFWVTCSSNGIAFTFRGDNILEIKQANSRYVYSHDGNEISDIYNDLPGGYGMPESCLPICGNINGDNAVDILDITHFIDFKFKDGDPPHPAISADVNSDGMIDVLDIVHFIDFKFKEGPDLDCFVLNFRLIDFYNGGIFQD
jgi:hypothetical protein